MNFLILKIISLFIDFILVNIGINAIINLKIQINYYIDDINILIESVPKIRNMRLILN